MQPVSDSLSNPLSPPEAAGKRRLIEAALRLAARGSSLSSLGLRELAREAGLNHNTFYRHFARMEDLAQAATAKVAAQLMAGMKEVRRSAGRHADATDGAVDYYLEFVTANPDVFVVGARELHSAGSPMRAALLRTLRAIAEESVEQIAELDLVPIKQREPLLQVTFDIAHHMLCRALDLVEHPDDRAQIRMQMIGYIRRQFFGAMVMQQSRATAASQGDP